MKFNFLLLLLISGQLTLFAQVENTEIIDDFFSDNFIIEADSIMNTTDLPEHVSDFIVESVGEDVLQLIEDTSDDVFIARLSAIMSPVELPFNDVVKSFIKLYTQRRKGQVERMLGLSEYYFPIFEEALDAQNMPLELKYLPIIESALNPVALSRAGASGIWQFMYRTGKLYGLEVNSYVDERRDPVKSTYAAVKYLSDLYNMYNDWHLAIAAYNCGPGNINKAIKRSGGKRNFWEIYPLLPQETRSYVPAFIAATYVMYYAAEHKFTPQPSDLPSNVDTIMVFQPLHFEQLTSILNISVKTLRELNPQYRRDIIPATEKKGYALILPTEQTLLFASFEDSVYNYRRTHFFPDNKLVVVPSDTKYPVTAPDGKVAIQYTVKSGDAVGVIAERFNVRASDLRYWNNINKDLIRVGQKLTIYVPMNKESHYKAVAVRSSKTASTSTQKAETSESQKTTTSEPQNQSDDNKKYEYYIVQSGDNFWSIAKKYPGVSNEDIMKLNNITDDRKLKPGQKLKIRVI